MQKTPGPEIGRGFFAPGEPVARYAEARRKKAGSGLFLHLLAAALQGHGAGGFAFAAGAGFFHGHFQAAHFTMVDVADIHFRAICHAILPSFRWFRFRISDGPRDKNGALVDFAMDIARATHFLTETNLTFKGRFQPNAIQHVANEESRPAQFRFFKQFLQSPSSRTSTLSTRPGKTR